MPDSPDNRRAFPPPQLAIAVAATNVVLTWPRSVPGFDYNLWVGMFGPASMPAELVERINKDVQKALTSAEIKERFATLGAEAMPMTTAQFKKFVADDMEASAKIVKAANIKAQ